MSKCYICGTELTPENGSEEHIILNALGGRYKTKKLLCKKCNNNSGSDYDAVLANQYHFFTSILGVDLARGKPPVLSMKADDGQTYIIQNGTTPVLSHPIVKNEKIDETSSKISITARSKEELEQKLNDFKKKGYKIDIEEAMKNAVYRREPSPTMHSMLSFGGIESFPAILKMAVSQYIDKTDDIENVKSAIEDIRNPPKDIKDFKKVELCILEKDIFEVEEGEISHSILLNASAEKQKLYAVIQLFNTQQYIVKLSDTYNGSDFTDLYVYDVLKKSEIKKEIIWTPDFDFIFYFKYPALSPDFSIMQHRTHRVMEIAMRAKEEQWRADITKEMTKRIIEEIRLRFENGNPPSEEEIHAMCDKLADEYLPKKAE